MDSAEVILMDHHFMSVQEVPAEASVVDSGEPHGDDPCLAAFALIIACAFIACMIYISTN